jgi:CPA2 family monovalent cation:H+ antiporter-2
MWANSAWRCAKRLWRPSGALAEWGQTATPHGRLAIGILLFQDVALVPLMLLVPFLADMEHDATFVTYGVLALKAALFVVPVPLLRTLVVR